MSPLQDVAAMIDGWLGAYFDTDAPTKWSYGIYENGDFANDPHIDLLIWDEPTGNDRNTAVFVEGNHRRLAKLPLWQVKSLIETMDELVDYAGTEDKPISMIFARFDAGRFVFVVRKE